MNLHLKSKENFEIAQYCLQKKAYNCGVSRAYYSIYQKIMGICEENSVNLHGYSRGDDKYPHGAIGGIFSIMIKSISTKQVKDTTLLDYGNKVSSLQRKRITADYKIDMIAQSILKEEIDKVQEISKFIDTTL